jgi:hypothetical protein
MFSIATKETELMTLKKIDGMILEQEFHEVDPSFKSSKLKKFLLRSTIPDNSKELDIYLKTADL